MTINLSEIVDCPRCEGSVPLALCLNPQKYNGNGKPMILCKGKAQTYIKEPGNICTYASLILQEDILIEFKCNAPDFTSYRE